MIKITGKLWLLALCLSLIFSTALSSAETATVESKISEGFYYIGRIIEFGKDDEDKILGPTPTQEEGFFSIVLSTVPTLIVVLCFIFTWKHIYTLKKGLQAIESQLKKIVPPKSEESMEFKTTPLPNIISDLKVR